MRNLLFALVALLAMSVSASAQVQDYQIRFDLIDKCANERVSDKKCDDFEITPDKGVMKRVVGHEAMPMWELQVSGEPGDTVRIKVSFPCAGLKGDFKFKLGSETSIYCMLDLVRKE